MKLIHTAARVLIIAVLLPVLLPVLSVAYLYFSWRLRRRERNATPEQIAEVREIAEALMRGRRRNGNHSPE